MEGTAFTPAPPLWRRATLGFRILATMGAFGLATRILPYRLWRPVASRSGRVRPAAASRPPHVAPQRIVNMVARIGRLVPRGGNCLVRALTARAVLARYGHASRLALGIAKSDTGRLDGHAWLEFDAGRILLGGPIDRFLPLPDVDHRL